MKAFMRGRRVWALILAASLLAGAVMPAMATGESSQVDSQVRCTCERPCAGAAMNLDCAVCGAVGAAPEDCGATLDSEPALLGMPRDGALGTQANPFKPANTFDEVKTAIEGAAENTVLHFGEGTFTFGGAVTIAKPVDIRGAGADKTVIKSAGGARHFVSKNDVSLTLSGMTLQGPSATTENGPHGGIESGQSGVSTGILTLTGMTIRGCSGPITYHGGGIRAAGPVVITDCTITGNRSDKGGGAVYSDSTVTITNSTVAGNTSGTGGGGVCANGAVTITNCTIAGNTSGGNGSGVYGWSTLYIRGSIVAGNTGGSDVREDSAAWPDAGPTAENNYSIIGYAAGYSQANVFGSAGPVLGDNGGPTLTLLPGSAAMGKIPDTASWLPAKDQRGTAREFPSSIGAVDEKAPASLVVSSTADTEEAGTLRAAITAANAVGEGSAEITFDPAVFGTGKKTITLTTALPEITRSVTITGPGADRLTIQSANGFRHFTVRENVNIKVAMSGMTLAGPGKSGGTADKPNGGIHLTKAGTLTLSGMTLRDCVNREGPGGAVCLEESGILTIANCTIANNEAAGDGGGVCAGKADSGVFSKFINCTITGNTLTGGGTTGGGVFTMGGVYLTSCTITGNAAPNTGGGVWANEEHAVFARGCIIAGNTAPTCPNVYAGNVNWPDAAPAESNNYSIIGYPAGFSQAEVFGTAGPTLADNGGPTPTILPGGGAVDVVPTAKYAEWITDPGEHSDQRGIPRPDGPAVDAGAVELARTYSLVVSSTADTEDEGTLRNAVLAVNKGVGAEITFDPAVFGTGKKTITLTTALPEITKPITITGPGEDRLTIRSAEGSRHFAIANNLNAAMSGMTLQGPGKNGGAAGEANGGILGGNDPSSTGTLTLNNMTIKDCSNRSGVDNAGGGVLAAGNAILTGCTVTGNAVTTNGGAGGGVYVHKTAALTDCAVTGNTAAGDAASGGGLLIMGGATIDSCTITNNTVAGDVAPGGGIYLNAAATLTNCTITGNGADTDGGGVYVGENADSTFTGCTFSGNSAEAMGGGAYVARNCDSTFINCTLAGNSAVDTGGGLDSWGSSTVITSTITGNSAGTKGGGVRSTAGLEIRGSIVAGNTSRGTDPNINTDDVVLWPDAAPGEENHYSIIGYTEGYSQAEVFGQGGPVLGDNGGPTQTILPGSGAVEKIPDSAAVRAWLPAKDQRGVTRSSPATIGAVEDTRQYSLAVSSTADTEDEGTLRNAILAVNKGVGAQITFDPAVFGTEKKTITLTRPLPEFAAPVTITGPGEERLTIRSAAGSRHFAVADSIDAAMSGMTLQGPGRTAGTDGAVNGGIRSGSGALTLTDMTIRDCSNKETNATGGAVAGNGAVTLTGCTLQNNAAAGEAGAGGGVFAGGRLTMSGCDVKDNAAAGGGGVFAGGTAGITGCAITGNEAAGANAIGGGMYAGGNATIDDCTIAGNKAAGQEARGGGMWVSDGITVRVTGSAITGNKADGNGGGMFVYPHSEVTLSGCTVSGNAAGKDGGGVRAVSEDTSVNLINSTVFGNTAVADGGGVMAPAELTVTASTIAGNTAGKAGGGVWAPSGSTINGSIIAGNTAGTGGADGHRDNPWPSAAPSEENHYSIIGYTEGYSQAEVFGADGPVLGDNGGPTQTVLPGGGAKRKIPDSAAVRAWLPEKDQRGVERHFPACIGAVELSGNELQDLTGVTPGGSVEAGGWIEVTAVGVGMEEENPVPGVTRWLPWMWQVNPQGYFPENGPYVARFNTAEMSPGPHTLTITFKEQAWRGASWTDTGNTDVQSVSFTLTSPDPGPGGGSDDGRDGEYEFWQQVREAIEQAKENTAIAVSARGYDRMPWDVMEALRERPQVALEITWQGGETIVIPMGKALPEEAGRIYYPLAYLAERYDWVESRSTSTYLPPNPETGGVLEIAAPEAAEKLPATPADRGMAAAGEEARPTQPAVPGSEAAGVWFTAVLALAALAAAGLAFRRHRQKRED